MRWGSLARGWALVLWAVPGAPARAGDPAPKLAGSWEINLEKSQGPQQALRGDPDGGFSRSTLGSFERGLSELLRPKQRLTITQTDSLITVTDDAGWLRELLPNGQLLREELGQGGPANVITRWKGTKLVAERRLDRGGIYRETYSLDKKSGRLVLEVNFSLPRLRSFDGKRVYDADRS